MKPWRPYWKHLEKGFDDLRDSIGNPVWEDNTERIGGWISDLKYSELSAAYIEVSIMVSHWERGLDYKYSPGSFGGEPVAWQLLLRISFALDFCRGNIFKRKDFDWSQSSSKIWNYLLLELWRENAPYWAHRTFGFDHKPELLRRQFMKIEQAATPCVKELN